MAGDSFGAALLAAGLGPEEVKAWSIDPQIEGVGSLFDSMEDLGYDACLAKAVEINQKGAAEGKKVKEVKEVVQQVEEEVKKESKEKEKKEEKEEKEGEKTNKETANANASVRETSTEKKKEEGNATKLAKRKALTDYVTMHGIK